MFYFESLYVFFLSFVSLPAFAPPPPALVFTCAPSLNLSSITLYIVQLFSLLVARLSLFYLACFLFVFLP